MPPSNFIVYPHPLQMLTDVGAGELLDGELLDDEWLDDELLFVFERSLLLLEEWSRSDLSERP